MRKDKLLRVVPGPADFWYGRIIESLSMSDSNLFIKRKEMIDKSFRTQNHYMLYLKGKIKHINT